MSPHLIPLRLVGQSDGWHGQNAALVGHVGCSRSDWDMLHSAGQNSSGCIGNALLIVLLDRSSSATNAQPSFLPRPSHLPKLLSNGVCDHNFNLTRRQILPSSPTPTSPHPPQQITTPPRCRALLLRAAPARSPSTSASSMISRMSLARAHTVWSARRCTSLLARRSLSRKSPRSTSKSTPSPIAGK